MISKERLIDKRFSWLKALPAVQELVNFMEDSELSDDEAGGLRKAFEHVKALRGENASLRENFENLKQLYSVCLDGKQQLEAQVQGMQQDMDRMDRHYESLSASWQRELDVKQRNVEEAEAKVLKPTDVKAMQLKLVEELEVPQKARCQFLEQEASKAQQQVWDTKRELERLRLDAETQVARAVKEGRERQEELMAELGEKDVQMQRLRNEPALHEGVNKPCTALEQQLETVRTERSELLREIEQLRSEKEHANVEKARASIEAERQAHALRAEASQQRRQIDMLSRKNLHFENELQQAMREIESAQQRVGQLEREHQLASAEAERTIHQLESAVFNLETQLATASEEWEEQRQDLQAQIDEKEGVLEQLEEAHKEQTSVLAQECAEKVKQEEERQRDLRRALEGEAADLRALVTSLEEAAREIDVRHAEQLADVQRESDRARKELQQSELDVKSLVLKLEERKEEVERAQRDGAAARQEALESAMENEAVRERQRDTEKYLAEVTQERDRLQQKLDRSERNLAELAAVAEREREELEEQLEIERQHQHELGRRSALGDGAWATREEYDNQAAKASALKKKVQKYRKLLATAAAERVEFLRRLKTDAGVVHSPLKQVRSDGAPAPLWETAWYRTQVDTLRERQGSFLRA